MYVKSSQNRLTTRPSTEKRSVAPSAAREPPMGVDCAVTKTARHGSDTQDRKHVQR